MQLHERITTNPAVANGMPCIRNTGITVKQIEKLLKSGQKAQEILPSYPQLEAFDLQAIDMYLRSPDKIQPVKAEFFTIADLEKAYNAKSEEPFCDWYKRYKTGETNTGEIEVHQPVIEETEPEVEVDNTQNLPNNG